MYILGCYLNLINPFLNPIIVLTNADVVLLLASETPASSLDEKTRKLVWTKLWRDRYRHYQYNNPKYMCSVKSADFAKVIAAAKTLGIQGTIKYDGIYFNDGSKIGIWHPIFKYWAKR